MTELKERMLVNIVTISIISKDATNFKTFFEELGNVPKYDKLDGGDCAEYQLCLDVNIDVEKLCKKNNYFYCNSQTIEVNKDEYNNNYEVGCNMSSNHFELCKHT